MKRVSMSYFPGFSVEEGKAVLRHAKDTGLDAVDLGLNPFSVADDRSIYATGDETQITAYFRALREYADELGIAICMTHGRIAGYRTDPAHNRDELASFRWDALATAVLGARFCVVHSVHLGLDAAPEDQRRLNRQMMEDYLPLAKRYGVRLAMETLGDTHAADGRDGVDFFGDFDEYFRAFEEVARVGDNRDWLCACVDTGHTNKTVRFPGQIPPGEFIRRLGDRVQCLHLNDNNGLTDQHKVPLSGTVDWQDVLAALQEIGYAGDYNMELNLRFFGKQPATMDAYERFAVQVMREMLNG